MTKRVSSCGDCRFAYRVGQGMVMTCRFTAPFAGPDGKAVWPRVKVDDFCCSFEKRGEAK